MKTNKGTVNQTLWRSIAAGRRNPAKETILFISSYSNYCMNKVLFTFLAFFALVLASVQAPTISSFAPSSLSVKGLVKRSDTPAIISSKEGGVHHFSSIIF
jgi:hypothetical protein